MENSEDATRILNFRSLIEDYEVLITDLTKEIAIFQKEHCTLNKRIKQIVRENEKLSKDIADLLAKNNSKNPPSCSSDPQIIENLKQQLSLIVIEKDYTMQLWQNAVTAIEHLESELKVYQEGSVNFVPKKEVTKLKNHCDSRIKVLEQELQMTKFKCEETLAVNSKQTLQCKVDAENALSSQNSSCKIIKNLEEEILSLQTRLKSSTKMKDELTKIVTKQNAKIALLMQKNKECAEKVSEAVHVVEAALNEKDCALLREQEARNEVVKTSKNFVDFIQEAEQNLKKEVESVKTEYNANLKAVLDDLKQARCDSKCKQNEIDSYVKQCSLLEIDIERLHKGTRYIGDGDHSSQLLTLEKNLEKTFQKLLTSEKENIVLHAEITRKKNDMSEMAERYEADVKCREIEKIALQSKVQELKEEISRNDQKYKDIMQRMEDMKENLVQVKEKYEEKMLKMKGDLELSYSADLKSSKMKDETVIKDLGEQLGCQLDVHKKWRVETKLMIEKLEAQVRRQKNILFKLHEINKHLHQKLKSKKLKKKKKAIALDSEIQTLYKRSDVM